MYDILQLHKEVKISQIEKMKFSANMRNEPDMQHKENMIRKIQSHILSAS